MNNKRVLVVYATGGMGHVTAAKAVVQAFSEEYSDVEVKNVDVLDYSDPVYKKVFVGGYNWVSSNKPGVWGKLYRLFNKPASQKLPTLISRMAVEKKFINFVKDFNPDFIVSTHPLPMILVSHSKEKDLIDLKSSMVITDFGCHSFWVDPEVNFYFCATDIVAKCLSGYGADPNKMVVTGIPIHTKFSKILDKQATVKKLKLDPKLKTVLIVGGQFDFAALKKVVGGIKKQNEGKVQFLLVAGRDKELEQALNNSDLGKDKNINVYGFVDNMEEMMSVADLIFSKAGGLTVSECLAKGLPMVINKVIPGQEEDNVNYLVDKGAAVKADDFDGIISAVNDLLANPEKLSKMQQVAKSIGHPNSAKDLADFVMKEIS